MKILVTGGAGFIGSALVRYLVMRTMHEVINVDCLTYAGNLSSLEQVATSGRYHFEKVDIRDGNKISKLLSQYEPNAVIHLAAESHVDRSIDSPSNFIDTNITGTYVLLEQIRLYLQGLDRKTHGAFRFIHVSTDEVYGSLGEDGFFTEESPYRPNSPYSASKASSDHLVRAWHATYGLPVMITNCSNNYGPYQFPEKLIPTLILNALSGNELPIYGDGLNIRDWLYVGDHVRALLLVLNRGKPGETYNIGASAQKTNLEVANTICRCLDRIKPKSSGTYADQIVFVEDRPGHDRRYAIDATKIRDELEWTPLMPFEAGIIETINWYMANSAWCQGIFNGSYRLERIGLKVNT